MNKQYLLKHCVPGKRRSWGSRKVGRCSHPARRFPHLPYRCTPNSDTLWSCICTLCSFWAWRRKMKISFCFRLTSHLTFTVVLPLQLFLFYFFSFIMITKEYFLWKWKAFKLENTKIRQQGKGPNHKNTLLCNNDKNVPHQAAHACRTALHRSWRCQHVSKQYLHMQR